MGEREAISRAMATLPALQRAVLIFTALDGLTVREAAVLIDRSEPATESLLHRARAGLPRGLWGRRDRAMTDDGLLLLLSRLEEMPPVRPAFADALRERLVEELGSWAPSTPGLVTRKEERPPRRLRGPSSLTLPSLRPLTLRGLLAAAALILLLVAVAAATGLVIRDWLSAGPAGPQYTDDFTLTQVYREPGVFYLDLHLAPDGRSLLAMRVPVGWPDREPAEGAIVSFEPASDGSWRPRDVLPFERLRDPALWDPGTLLTDVAIGRTPNMPDSVSVAQDGSVFVAASLYELGLTRPQGASTIAAMDSDGSLQPVLTSGELLASGLFDRLNEVIGMSVVASEPGVLWGRVDGPVADPPGNHTWLFTVTDPNSDGDWSDRVIRPIRLPPTVPQVEYGVYERSYGAFVAEPAIGDQDGPRSVLLPVLERDGAIRIYRLRDAQADGDLTAPGEVELVYEGLTSSEAADLGTGLPISRRVVDLPGDQGIDEIVAGGLSRASRVSRITPDGIVDVVRALPTWADDVEADREGRVYVVTQEPGEMGEDDTFEPPTLLIYRLDPVPVEAGPAHASSVPATDADSGISSTSPPSPPSPRASSPPSPGPAPLWEPAPLTAGVPRVAFAAYGPTGSGQQEALVVGIDGSGPGRVVAEGQVWSFCQSADGRQVISRSVLDVPGEPFVRVAAADGTGQVTVSETANLYWCGFPADAVLLGTGQDALSPQTVIRHDLATGTESIVAAGVVVLGISPDGTRLAVVDESDRSRLEVVDVATGERRTVAGPDDRAVRAAWWAPDGMSVAYLTGETTGFDPSAEEDLVLRVVDLAGGPPRTLHVFHGREPGDLLVGRLYATAAARTDLPLGRVRARHARGSLVAHRCGLGRGPHGTRGRRPLGRLVAGRSGDLRLRHGRRALRGDRGVGESTRLLDRPPDPLCDVCWAEGPWQVGHWLGWSPDGRFIGLGKYSGAIAAVDVATGALLVPLVSDEQRWIDEPRWWR